MGVDTRLFISNDWETSDVQECLESLYGKVTYEASRFPDLSVLSFSVGDEKRRMNVHRCARYGGISGVLLNLRANPTAEKVMELIAKRLGGWLNRKDTNEQWEKFDTLGEGDLSFFVKHAIVNGETDGRDLDKFYERSKALNKKLGGKS